MKIKFLDHDVRSWITPRVIPPRTVGRHVSEVVVKMLQALPGRKYDRYGRAADGDRKATFEVGYLWEDVLRKRVDTPAGYIHVHDQEISRGGIYGTPDRILWHDGNLRFTLEETKATWMSARGLDTRPEALLENTKFTYWLLQSKTYAAMLLRYVVFTDTGAPVLVALPDDGILAELHTAAGAAIQMRRKHPFPPLVNIRALFMNGDYRGTLATPACWQIEYTADELEDWWSSIVQFVADNPLNGGQDSDIEHDPTGSPTS